MDQRDKEKLTEMRHSLPEGINNYVRSKGTHKVATDIAVPSSKFNEMMHFHVEVGLEIQLKRIINDLRLPCDKETFDNLPLPEKVKFVEDQTRITTPSGNRSEPSPEGDDDSLADRVDAIRSSSKTEVAYAIFGHIGDYHLHFNFLPRTADELEQMKKASYRLAKKGVELGGTITAEHGVGKKTYVDNGAPKPYLELMYGRQGLESIATIKTAIDPNWILNRGNVVTAEYSKQNS
jgi:FAD/FMN-containing dehydrogenase